MSQIRQTVSGKSKFVSVSRSNIQTLEKVQTASAQTGKIFEETKINSNIRLIPAFASRESFLSGAGSLPAGLRQWRRVEERGLGIEKRRAQDFSMSTTAKNAKVAKINEFVL
ncbi:MAG: hypothetical protein Q8M95_04610 [Candidatus Methanoperedens sp.]|nr:hypothetical protein [Candidatus Methanoperedens sp.]